MAIDLSNITFTDQDDVVPQLSGWDILNTGIANTLAGNDEIRGTKYIGLETPPHDLFSSISTPEPSILLMVTT